MGGGSQLSSFKDEGCIYIAPDVLSSDLNIGMFVLLILLLVWFFALAIGLVFVVLSFSTSLTCGCAVTASLALNLSLSLASFSVVLKSRSATCKYFCDAQNCDNVHPNDAGYAFIASTIRAGIGL
uniref:Uncharacterized protein n=1 Tax=Lotharella oceanica TaxID=641309 RepID=A0A7S2TZ90_9EUKA|mmetsp:Transcript_36725/g.67821  ORF Transcript_36725/g.67821 Transcript_36725/m.67821 type:complete len:125 (+) Transcript_36725:137-511(+)